jgi:hypothetical protein
MSFLATALVLFGAHARANPPEGQPIVVKHGMAPMMIIERVCDDRFRVTAAYAPSFKYLATFASVDPNETNPQEPRIVKAEYSEREMIDFLLWPMKNTLLEQQAELRAFLADRKIETAKLNQLKKRFNEADRKYDSHFQIWQRETCPSTKDELWNALSPFEKARSAAGDRAREFEQEYSEDLLREHREETEKKINETKAKMAKLTKNMHQLLESFKLGPSAVTNDELSSWFGAAIAFQEMEQAEQNASVPN